MLTRINKPRDDRDAGFTLIELLVVVAIIGILAAIAIPVFLNQRASARDASVKADLNGIAKVMETVYTSEGAYPTATGGDAILVDNDAVTSPGNVIKITNPDTSSFVITACNAESTEVYQYNSATGGLLAEAVNVAENDCVADGADAGVVQDSATESYFGTLNPEPA